MKMLLGWVASAAALMIVAYVLPGFHVTGFGAAMIAAVVIGFINATLGSFVKLMSLPARVLTLGLFSLVINAFMLLLADWFLDGLTIDGFVSAFIGSILLSIVSGLLHRLLPDEKKADS